ncbi:MAG: GNAT family N-acetyltransferase [Chloroflexi bacterium]|nr:MAG: GNAT family N-acetyltransferase [Chloroflexota bacterium]
MLRDVPGSVLDSTDERVIEFRPGWPGAGPNGVRRVSCSAERLPSLIDEVRDLGHRHGTGLDWRLDEWNQAELAPVLLAKGLKLDAEVTIMELLSEVEEPPVPGLELADGMADVDAFRTHHATVAAGFRDVDRPVPEGDLRTRYNSVRVPGQFLVTAFVFGEPAGGGGLSVEHDGASLSGGSVLPKFRHRGVYRALVAERARLAHEAGAPFLITNARPASRPILEFMGFRPIGRWWGYKEPPTR